MRCFVAALQMPHSLQFEPMKLCGPSVTCLAAGSTLSETSISVLNGAGAKVVKALIAGRRHHLEVVSDSTDGMPLARLLTLRLVQGASSSTVLLPVP